jgi:hypothetical protein
MFFTFAAVKPENSFQHFIPTEGINCSSETGLVRVPEDHKSLNEAVMWIETYNTFLTKIKSNKMRMTNIVLGKGEHVVEDYLQIPSAMNIVGDPEVSKEKIVVVGGIHFKKGIEGNCHLQHLTLRQSKKSGVWASSSFTMDDVIVEQCKGDGVRADGTGVVGRCTNVEVRQCGLSGVLATNGASITLIGAKTTVHHNCTTRTIPAYGLTVMDYYSTIQLVSPLTKEQVSLDNSGGANWGGSYKDNIKNISQ